jgi:ribosomal protein S18 acetylase RimI-like enzyme
MGTCDVVHLRRARESDARGIAEVHVETYRTAFRSDLPAHYLEAITVADRESYWARELRALPPERRPWVAEADDRLVGFVAAGAAHHPGASALTGEVYMLFVLPECWDRGLGRNLLAHAERDLLVNGYTEAEVWIPIGNERANSFGSLAGWQADGQTRTSGVGSTELVEARYRIALDRSRVAELV